MDSPNTAAHEETLTTSFNRNYEAYDNLAATFDEEGKATKNQLSEGSPDSQSDATEAFDDGVCQVTSFGIKKEITEDQNEDNFKVLTETTRDQLDMTSLQEEEIPAAYAGMPKEVLLHYSRKPVYLWAREIFFWITILIILALLAMVIAFVAVSPACQQFWQTSPIYQIYPKSFYDTDNDGFGDLKGILEKLPYVMDLGVTAVLLNPIYKSPQKDHGYDVTDHQAIDQIFGSLDDFDELATALHREGMKIVMDFVPNHTSNRHRWFNASSNPSHKEYEKYKDYYVWVNGTGPNGNQPPNNWQSVYAQEGSAWEWNAERRQFYYHTFYKEQPDLNLRNKEVREELKNVLTFWFENGVDGFRIGGIKYLYEANHLRDNPLKNPNAGVSYDNLWPDHTENQFENHDLVAEWRSLFKKYSNEPGVYRFMETEVYDTTDVVIRYYGTPLVKEADFPMNFRLIDLEKPESWTASNIEANVMEWMMNMPEDRWPNWVIGNHDHSRVVSRLGEKKARLAAILTMLLAGTPSLYYGEEIGMTDGQQINDFRDPERTPMQWDASENGGFCSNCTPWLPVNGNTNMINVQSQVDSSNGTTMLCLYKKLIEIRMDVIFTRGSLCVLHSNSNVFMFVREVPGSSLSSLVAINFGNAPATVDVKTIYSSNLPDTGEVIFKSTSCHTLEKTINFKSMTLEAEDAIVVHFKPPKGSALFSKTSSTSGRCFTPSKVCIDILNLLEVC